MILFWYIEGPISKIYNTGYTKSRVHCSQVLLVSKEFQKHGKSLSSWLAGQFCRLSVASPATTHPGYIIPPNGCLLVDNNEIRIDVYPPSPHSWQTEKIYSSGLHSRNDHLFFCFYKSVMNN